MAQEPCEFIISILFLLLITFHYLELSLLYYINQISILTFFIHNFIPDILLLSEEVGQLSKNILGQVFEEGNLFKEGHLLVKVFLLYSTEYSAISMLIQHCKVGLLHTSNCSCSRFVVQ